jgi:hypothetical protein
MGFYFERRFIMTDKNFNPEREVYKYTPKKGTEKVEGRPDPVLPQRGKDTVCYVMNEEQIELARIIRFPQKKWKYFQWESYLFEKPNYYIYGSKDCLLADIGDQFKPHIITLPFEEGNIISLDVHDKSENLKDKTTTVYIQCMGRKRFMVIPENQIGY